MRGLLQEGNTSKLMETSRLFLSFHFFFCVLCSVSLIHLSLRSHTVYTQQEHYNGHIVCHNMLSSYMYISFIVLMQVFMLFLDTLLSSLLRIFSTCTLHAHTHTHTGLNHIHSTTQGKVSQTLFILHTMYRCELYVPSIFTQLSPSLFPVLIPFKPVIH